MTNDLGGLDENANRQAQIKEDIQERVRRVYGLHTMAMPREEVVRRVERMVDKQAEQYCVHVRELIRSVAQHTEDDSDAATDWSNLPLLSLNAKQVLQDRVVPGALYRLLGEAIKETVRAEVEAMVWQPSMSSEEQSAELANLEAELHQLSEQLRDLEKEAKALRDATRLE